MKRGANRTRLGEPASQACAQYKGRHIILYIITHFILGKYFSLLPPTNLPSEPFSTMIHGLVAENSNH